MKRYERCRIGESLAVPVKYYYFQHFFTYSMRQSWASWSTFRIQDPLSEGQFESKTVSGGEWREEEGRGGNGRRGEGRGWEGMEGEDREGKGRRGKGKGWKGKRGKGMGEREGEGREGGGRGGEGGGKGYRSRNFPLLQESSPPLIKHPLNLSSECSSFNPLPPHYH